MKNKITILYILLVLFSIIETINNVNGQAIGFVNTTGAIAPPGALPGSVDVSAMGAASYSIPIGLPAALGGNPQLSIEYNSNAGEGLLGVKWDLSGLSEISRVPKTFDIDGISTSVAFDTTDRFVLDGQRLLSPTSTYGSNGCSYKKIAEDFSTIISYGTAAGGPDYFVVTTPSGTTLEYKQRCCLNGLTIAYKWLISKVTDRLGNSMSYTYTNDASNNQCLISTIQYGRSNQAYTVTFTYKDKSNISTQYVGGYKFSSSKIISYISISNGVKYTFSHNNDFLSSVSLTKGTTLMCKPTTINWASVDDNFSFANITNDDKMQTGNYTTNTCDVDGDGKNEIAQLSTNSNTWSIYNMQGTAFKKLQGGTMPDQLYYDSIQYYKDKQLENGQRETSTIPTDIAAYAGRVDMPRIYYDINKDGKAELCLITPNAAKNPTSATLKAYQISGNTLVSLANYTTTLSNIPKWGSFLLAGNFTGEGQSLLCLGGSMTTANIINTTKAINVVGITSDFYSKINFNNNEREDILVYSKGKFSVYEAKPIGSNQYEFNVISTIVLAASDTAYQVLPGDFNGDGLSDVVFYDSKIGKWRMFFSDGKSSFVESSINPPISETLLNPSNLSFSDYTDFYRTSVDKAYNYNRRVKTNVFIVDDVNHDGKSDIIRIQRKIKDGTYPILNSSVNPLVISQSINVCISTGTDFITTSHPSGDITYKNGSLTHFVKNSSTDWGPMDQRQNDYDFEKFIYGDLNNDGFCELAYIEKYDANSNLGQMIETSSSTDYYIGSLFTFKKGIDGNKVTQITNGKDIKTNITYALSNNTSVYTHTPNASLNGGILQNRLPLTLVSNVKTTYLVSGTDQLLSNIDYTYNTVRYHEQKGFLGFASFTVKDQVTSKKTVTNFSIDPTYYVPYPSYSGNYIGAGLISESTNSSVFNKISSKRYYGYNQKTTSKDNLSGVVNTVTLNMDINSGNALNKTETYGSDLTVLTTFGTSAADFVYGQPKTIITKSTRSSGSATTTQTLEYLPNGNLSAKNDNIGMRTEFTYYPDNTNINTQIIKDSQSNILSTATYTNDGLHVTGVSTITGGKTFTESYSYNSDGQVLNSTGKNGLTSVNTYDTYGALATTTAPNGRKIYSAYGYGTLAGHTDATSYATVTDDTGAKSTIWYNNAGQTLQKQTTPAGGLLLTTDYVYDTKGRLTSETTNGLATTYTYDEYWHPTTVTSKGTTTTYAYSGLTTRVTSLGLTSEKTVNAAGEVISSTNAGGSVAYTYLKTGNVGTITTNGTTVTMTYFEDETQKAKYGKQKTLVDPDAGTTTYDYDYLGRLINQTDSKGNATTLTYDATKGWLTKKTVTATGQLRTIDYTYYDDITKYGLVKTETLNESGGRAGTQTMTTARTYDDYGHLTSKTETISGVSYLFSYTYDIDGHLLTTTYPDNYKVTNTFTGNFLNKVADNVNSTLASNITYNSFGLLTGYSATNNALAITYDQYGYTTDIKATVGTNTLTHSYALNWTTANITGRSYTRVVGGVTKASLAETFTYDAVDRLTDVTNGTKTYEFGYAANGNMTFKSDAGVYGYESTQPHAVKKVYNFAGTAYKTQVATQEFNLIGKAAYLALINANNSAVTDSSLTFFYGPDGERRFSISKGGQKTIYVGSYELRSNGDRLHYVPGPNGVLALYVTNTKNTSKQDFYYLYTDKLGSLIAASDRSGNIVKEFSYDAWGRRRSTDNWTNYSVTLDALGTGGTQLFTRGFCFHEHLDVFGLINMNGRMYDPRLGRFLSPDNHVQSPGNSQSYNRYSYCMNNPLKYIDPSGYTWWSHFKGWCKDNAAQIGAITTIAVGVALVICTAGTVTPLLACAYGAIAGASGSFVGSSLSGANLGNVVRATLLGGAIGGCCGLVGGSMISSGFSKTFTACYTSLLGTTMSCVTHGGGDPSLNFGIGSINIGNGKVRTLFSKGNNLADYLSFGLGALGNVNDALKIRSELKYGDSDQHTYSSHTSGGFPGHKYITDNTEGGTVGEGIDYGPDKGEPSIPWGERATTRNDFTSYHNEPSDIMLRTFSAPTSAISAAQAAEGAIYNVLWSSCATYTSLAEFNSGYFTFGIVPAACGAMMGIGDYTWMGAATHY